MEPLRVAVIDDEPIACREMKRALEKDHYAVETFSRGEDALRQMERAPFDLVVCDLKLQGENGLQVLRKTKEKNPQTEFIIVTGYGSLDSAIEAIQSGAFHYVTKPIKQAVLRGLASKALEKVRLVKEKEVLKKALYDQGKQKEIIGHSPAMQEVFRLIEKMAPLTCNVLIQGESGTGKELVARALHFHGPRRNLPFVPFNCGGFTEELITNELFGHEKGAFTGAVNVKIGLLEAAQGGTIFLDEIGEMPPSMQVKLLRFIQERSFLRVGGTRPIEVDVRIIAASNQNLSEAVREKKFREDLYYRLNVVLISIPPLRQRLDDIPVFLRYFLSRYGQAFGKEITGADPDVLEVLQNYPYPGNVRELENIVERAVALADEGTIRLKDLPSDLQRLSVKSIEGGGLPSLEEKEREYIRKVLIETNYQRAQAAKVLKIPRTTLWRKMKRLGLD
ncbi:MAG: Fis family transcriptional regulator [Deltaproteobacteria bacterium HGW-Deltaproteobacteria-21]|nr:MAG: Fis family transcriptional regulator [Deltaproteobacteria bacterium HGW-Deltaproteobacteria-21]